MPQHTPEGQNLSIYLLDTTLAPDFIRIILRYGRGQEDDITVVKVAYA